MHTLPACFAALHLPAPPQKSCKLAVLLAGWDTAAPTETPREGLPFASGLQVFFLTVFHTQIPCSPGFVCIPSGCTEKRGAQPHCFDVETSRGEQGLNVGSLRKQPSRAAAATVLRFFLATQTTALGQMEQKDGGSAALRIRSDCPVKYPALLEQHRAPWPADSYGAGASCHPTSCGGCMGSSGGAGGRWLPLAPSCLSAAQLAWRRCLRHREGSASAGRAGEEPGISCDSRRGLGLTGQLWELWQLPLLP